MLLYTSLESCSDEFIALFESISQDFSGAIIAITHNRAFAEQLNATHILRVQVRHMHLTTLDPPHQICAIETIELVMVRNCY